MPNHEQLIRMENGRLRGTGNTLLADLLEVEISGSTPAERLQSYVTQVKDLYHFKVGKTPVCISFRSAGQDLERKLASYFISLKN